MDTIAQLHKSIMDGTQPETALWDALIAHQDALFHTSSGLPFTYTVHRRKNGEYSGELLVSRKEESKTLTRSSIMLAFHKVMEKMQPSATELNPPFFKGPKAIGQIFGISYIYSIFYRFGLISVPEKVMKRID